MTPSKPGRTPGPWIADNALIIRGPGREVVAEVKLPLPEQQGWVHRQAEANAALVAAAPDMEELLRELVESDPVVRIEQFQARARAALARAEGREP